MSEINYNIGLCGEYRLVVRDSDTVVSDTGWCKNTILSGGLEFLSTDSILNGITFLDLGTSSLSSNNYTLSGVLAPCVNNVLSSIPSTNIEYYKLNKNTQVYYSIFSSPQVTLQTESVNEFCVKSTNQTGFARAVLSEPVEIRLGQNINFEYRVSVDHTSLQEASVEFTTPNNSSFYIPITSKTFNIPNDETDASRVGRLVDDYILELSENTDTIPEFGDQYPSEGQTVAYGIESSPTRSRFAPSVVYSGLDDTTKQYSVITQYSNISASNNSGIFSNINSALLTYNTNAFNITRFAFPITVYNTTLFTTATSINAGNLITLYYSYAWGETLDSPFTTPITFSLSSPQLIPCNIDAEVDLYPESFLTLFSQSFTSSTANGNTTRIRVNLKGSITFDSIKVDYTTPQVDKDAFPFGPSPYRVVMYNIANQALKDTGYVFTNANQDWVYANSHFDSLNYYNKQLYSTVGQNINGSIPGDFELTNIPSPSGTYIDLVINSPLQGTSWEVILDTRESAIYDCTEQTNICIAFTDLLYMTESITLSGSLAEGSFIGYTISSGTPIRLNWDTQTSEWKLTYDDTTTVTAISGVSTRCEPVGALFNSSGIIVSLSTFGYC